MKTNEIEDTYDKCSEEKEVLRHFNFDNLFLPGDSRRKYKDTCNLEESPQNFPFANESIARHSSKCNNYFEKLNSYLFKERTPV